MLITLEYLKKETISLASLIEYNFTAPQNVSELHERKKDHYSIHKNSLKYLVNNSLLKKRDIRFINVIINISSSLLKIYKATDRLRFSHTKNGVFEIEIAELKNETSKKIKNSIDSFSYLNETMALKAYSSRSKLLTQIELTQNSITSDILESPKLMEDGLEALKTIFILKQIDEEVNEIIENVLYIDKRQSTSWVANKKITRVNMLDFIHTDKMINAKDCHE